MTTTPDPLHVQLTDLARELACGAGDLIRAQGHLREPVASKSSSTDVVTEVDRAVEAYLVNQIAARRPGDAVLGEEGGGRSGSTGVRWVLDPIDGTVNFMLGLPQFAVSVAVEVDGQTVAGCVHNPATGQTYHAVLGGGAYLDTVRLDTEGLGTAGLDTEGSGTAGLHTVRLTGPRDVPLARAVIGTGFGYEERVRRGQVAVVAQLLPRIADIRRLGSASLDLCAVAQGVLDAYFEWGVQEWDVAAGLLIAAEAGVVCSGLRGRPARSPFVLVAGAVLAPELDAVLTELDADRPVG